MVELDLTPLPFTLEIDCKTNPPTFTALTKGGFSKVGELPYDLGVELMLYRLAQDTKRLEKMKSEFEQLDKTIKHIRENEGK